MNKYLILTAKETKELKEKGLVSVSRGGITYEVTDSGIMNAHPQLDFTIVIPAKDKIILTGDQAKALKENGKTDVRKNGVDYVLSINAETNEFVLEVKSIADMTVITADQR